MAESCGTHRYHPDPVPYVAMHASLLQPLLILAAIAIVGAVPILGAASPAGVQRACSTVARGVECTTAGRQAADLARTPTASRDACRACRTDGIDTPIHRLARSLAWAIRGGACVLPPPRA